MAISKILDFSAGSKFAIKLPQDIRYDRETVKTVIEFYFLLPDFKSRGHPRVGIRISAVNKFYNQIKMNQSFLLPVPRCSHLHAKTQTAYIQNIFILHVYDLQNFLEA